LLNLKLGDCAIG